MLAFPLHPLTTILLLTAGIALISLEFNRPGLILAGAAGLLITLLAFASILYTSSPTYSLTVFAIAGTALFLDSRRPNVFLASMVFLACLMGFLLLLPRPIPILGGVISFLCAALIQTGTHILNRIARRARRNKGLD
jgi:membrane-bound ClpP family serine protease